MDKNEFKEMLKELCKSGEIELSISYSNDGYQYLRLLIDNETIFDEQIDKQVM